MSTCWTSKFQAIFPSSGQRKRSAPIGATQVVILSTFPGITGWSHQWGEDEKDPKIITWLYNYERKLFHFRSNSVAVSSRSVLDFDSLTSDFNHFSLVPPQLPAIVDIPGLSGKSDLFPSGVPPENVDLKHVVEPASTVHCMLKSFLLPMIHCRCVVLVHVWSGFGLWALSLAHVLHTR